MDNLIFVTNKTNFILRNIVFLLILLVFIAIIFIKIEKLDKNEVCFIKGCIEVELAMTQEEQDAGLSNRISLELNDGMLFVFEEEGDYPFWMKDMKFPLDIIWINKSGSVVDMFENADPCNGPVCIGIYPEANASYVLEVNAGTINKLKLKLSDNVEIKLKEGLIAI